METCEYNAIKQIPDNGIVNRFKLAVFFSENRKCQANDRKLENGWRKYVQQNLIEKPHKAAVNNRLEEERIILSFPTASLKTWEYFYTLSVNPYLIKTRFNLGFPFALSEKLTDKQNRMETNNIMCFKIASGSGGSFFSFLSQANLLLQWVLLLFWSCGSIRLFWVGLLIQRNS